jgi:hypothetical protein
MTKTPDPTELWQSLEAVDPAYCKEFAKPGGFKGTAIDPMWRTKRLTEVLGPCGIGWGYEVVAEGIEGEKSPVHWCRIRFWYKWDDRPGEFQAYGCTPVLMKRRDGMMVDEDFAKKSLTDAVMSAAMKIGTSSSIVLGTHEENRWADEGVQQAPRRNGAPTVNTAAPPQEGMAHGAGGDEQTCPKCGDQGRTMRFWEPGSRSPDLECATGCTEEYKGRTNPLKWWSVSKGSKKPTPQKAAFDAQAPQGHDTSQDEDIPF